MKDKITSILLLIIGLFSLGSFLYHVFIANKLIKLISFLSFSAAILFGILLLIEKQNNKIIKKTQ